jgi:hypothetical protein
MDESLEATVDPEPPTKMAGEFGASFSVMAGASQMTKLTPETYGIWSPSGSGSLAIRCG